MNKEQNKNGFRLNHFVSIAIFSLLAIGCGEKKSTEPKQETTSASEEFFPESAGEEVAVVDVASAAGEASVEEQMVLGKEKYLQICMACHQAEGQGIPSAFPPLAKSDYLNADVARAIDVVLNGKTGEITVNGDKYNSVMTAQNLTDEEVVNVLTYVYNSWGNDKKEVTLEMVKNARK